MPPYQSRSTESARGPMIATPLGSAVRFSGSVFDAFFNSTTVLRATSSARCLYSAVFHGVSVPAMRLCGTNDAGSRSPRRKRTRSSGRNTASISACVNLPALYAAATVGWMPSCTRTPVPDLTMPATASSSVV